MLITLVTQYVACATGSIPYRALCIARKRLTILVIFSFISVQGSVNDERAEPLFRSKLCVCYKCEDCPLHLSLETTVIRNVEHHAVDT